MTLPDLIDIFKKADEAFLSIDNSNAGKKVFVINFPKSEINKLGDLCDTLSEINSTRNHIEVTKAEDNGKYDVEVTFKGLKASFVVKNIYINPADVKNLLQINVTKEELNLAIHCYEPPDHNQSLYSSEVIEKLFEVQIEQEEKTGGFTDLKAEKD